MLEPIYSVYDERKRGIHILILSLGINWIWFNLFIGLVYKGMWVEMLLRGVSDVFAIYIFYRIAVWLQRKFKCGCNHTLCSGSNNDCYWCDWQ